MANSGLADITFTGESSAQEGETSDILEFPLLSALLIICIICECFFVLNDYHTVVPILVPICSHHFTCWNVD